MLNAAERFEETGDTAHVKAWRLGCKLQALSSHVYAH